MRVKRCPPTYGMPGRLVSPPAAIRVLLCALVVIMALAAA